MCTIFMLAIVQGLYVLRKDEGITDEEEPITEQYTYGPGQTQYGQQIRQQYGQQVRQQQAVRPGGPVQQPGRRPVSAADVDTDELGRKIEEATEESLNW